ncbi:MAG: VanZ family protein, partial [Planctomycetota bacterium]
MLHPPETGPSAPRGPGSYSSDRAADRGDRRAAEKPPVLRRRTVCLLSATCLVGTIYGTLGPLGLGEHAWIADAGTWQWRLPSTPSDAADVLANALVYLPAGLSLRLLCRRRGCAGWRDLVLSTLAASLLSYVTELCQQCMPARVASLTDWQVNTAAAFAGALFAVHVQRAARGLHAMLFAALAERRALRRIAAGLLLLIALAAGSRCIGSLAPRLELRAPRAAPAVEWKPFAREFRHSLPSAARSAAAQAAAFSVLTLVCLAAVRDRRGPAIAALLLCGVVGVSGLWRALFDPRGADITAPLLAVLAWAVTTRLWAALQPATRKLCNPAPPVR